MSTGITSTQQQDRVAQKHLANARQQAHAQAPLHGKNLGQAFAQLLSLACDEDTDLDASKLSSGPAGRATQDSDSEPELGTKARRKLGLDASDATGDNPVPATLHPTAQSNAVLLALLNRAALGEPAGATDYATGNATDNATDNATGKATGNTAFTHEVLSEQASGPAGAPETSAVASVPMGGTGADALPDELPPQPAPGKAVRDLARQLSVQRHNQELAQSLAQTPAASQAGLDAPRGLDVAWGRSASDAANTASLSNGPQSAELASTAMQQGSQASPHAGHMSHAGQPGSRLHGNGNASAMSPDATPEDITTAVSERPIAANSPVSNSGGQTQTGLGGEALGGAAHSETPQETLVEPGEQWQQQWSEAMEQVAQQVSYWAGSGGMRQATLRVGNGQSQAMDVKLSLKNGQADIEFRTNHEESRTAIAEGGVEVLRSLLASSGIDLGSVSVGGQSAGAEDQASSSATPTPQPRSLNGNGREGEAASGAQALLPALNEVRPRSASSVGLDVYV